MFRAAHEALGLLDVGAEEAKMTESHLRARFVVCEGERNWALRNVADATSWRRSGWKLTSRS